VTRQCEACSALISGYRHKRFCSDRCRKRVRLRIPLTLRMCRVCDEPIPLARRANSTVHVECRPKWDYTRVRLARMRRK